MEEAPVVVTAATGALGPVVANLSALLRRDGEYKLRRGTRKDIKLIRSKLKSIHSILWVIWEREHLDAEGKELRMEAWRLADDMNDAIDDFILSLKRSNDGRRFLEDKTKPSPCPFQDLKRRAHDVSQRCCNKWKMETSHTTFSSLFSRTKSTVDTRPGKWRPRVVVPYVHKDISELVEVEEPRDMLIKHLVGEEESTPQLKMASILGAAGVGKTTLARLVYEAIDKDKFKARAFVSVTSCHNMTEVLKRINQQVHGHADSTVVQLAGTKAATAEKHLIDDIWNFLKDKRYLVIIDDIWHCGEWETIKKSLPDNNQGSRIVTTTRYNAITDKWRDDFDSLVYKIDYHSAYDEVREMVIAMKPGVVGEGFRHRHGTVNKCAGMPLAVACLMSALAKERERQEQQGLCVLGTPALQDEILEQVKRNGIQKTPGFEPLVESLELGYKDLPHHMLKTCLLYCSIYPEDHDFKRDDLVRRWIAQGFVCKEEAGKDYLDELVSRGLFQEIETSSGNFVYRLHPMMRNYLRWKLREDNFITCTSDGIPSSPVGRLCIDNWPSSDAVGDPFSGIDWLHIRSLVVLEGAERVPKDFGRVPYNHLENLRVLDVQRNRGGLVLENQHLKDVCGFLRLRHLLLSGEPIPEITEIAPVPEITEIPVEIARLQYLETLQVTYTRIRRLPAEIGDLKQLKTLDVSWNFGLAELPREMGNLQHLETLIIRGSDYLRKQAWEIIGTLKKLKTLDVSDNKELSGIPRDIIGELQQLKNLYMSGNPRITQLPMEIGKLQNLETLNLNGAGITELSREIGNLQRLQALYLSETRITELPREIGNLQNLQALYLNCVETITKLPRDIGRLQHLERLSLLGTNVSKIPREIRRLKKLKNLDAFIATLPFEAGQLSKLEGLPKCVHKAWKNSDLVPWLAGEILSLEKTNRMVGDGGLIVGTKHMHIPQWIKEHFNNIGSLDIRICKLEEQDLKILREMPHLEQLKLRFGAVPRKPIAITGGGFARLWILTVDSRVPRIAFQEGAMPSLVWLLFEFQFYGGPPNTDPPMGIKHLVSLIRVIFRCNEWYRGDSPCISATIDVLRTEAREHPNEIKIEVPGAADYKESSEDRNNEASSSSGAEEAESVMAIPRRMLCRRCFFGPLSSRCFATESVLTPIWRILSRRSCLVFAGGCFAAVCWVFSGWMFGHRGIVPFVDNHCFGVSSVAGIVW